MKSMLISLVVGIILIASLGLFYVDYGPVKLYPVLRYQHIKSTDSSLPDYVNPLIFRMQMKYLHDNKFNVVPLKEVIKTYRKKLKVPKGTIALTFDGGYEDFMTIAYSSLKKYKFPATVFLSPSNIDKKGYMTKENIIHLYEDGLISIGSTGLGLIKNLARASGSAAYDEMFASRSSLIRELEIPIHYFSYPEGGVSQVLMNYARESRYKGACVLMPGKRISSNHPYAVKRITIHNDDGAGLEYKFKTWGNYVLFEEWRKK